MALGRRKTKTKETHTHYPSFPIRKLEEPTEMVLFSNGFLGIDWVENKRETMADVLPERFVIGVDVRVVKVPQFHAQHHVVLVGQPGPVQKTHTHTHKKKLGKLGKIANKRPNTNL